MLSYFLWANIYAALFFILYCLLIKGRPNNSWSRFYLLSALLVSLLLPAIRLDVAGPSLAKNIQAVQLPEIILSGSRKTLIQYGFKYQWGQIAYLFAAGILLLQFIYRAIALKVFLSRQELIQKEGFKLGINTGYGPASFGNVILFPEKEVDEAILKHEIAHLRLKHHYDKTTLLLLRCFFFPVLAFHLMYKELTMVHEFEADQQVDTDREIYSKILLSAHLRSNQLYLLQNFFHHPLKQRISMLYKSKTPDTGRKVLLLTFSAAALLAVLILQSNPLSAQEKKQTTEDKVYKSVEHVPEFPGGMDSLVSFLSANISYPDSARAHNIEGRVIIQFVVDKNGAIKDVEIKRDLPMGCGEEAKRVVSAMPKWTPGVHDGEKVNVYYTLPVTFKLSK